MKHNQEERRSGALERLKAQLEKGERRNKSEGLYVPLSDKNIKRINKEISILKEKLI